MKAARISARRTPAAGRLRILAFFFAAALLQRPEACFAAGAAALGELAAGSGASFRSFDGGSTGGLITGGYNAFGLMGNGTMKSFASTNASNLKDSLIPAFSGAAANVPMQYVFLQAAMSGIRASFTGLSDSISEAAGMTAKALGGVQNRRDWEPEGRFQSPCTPSVYGYNAVYGGRLKRQWAAKTGEALGTIGDGTEKTWSDAQEKASLIYQKTRKNAPEAFGSEFLSTPLTSAASKKRMLAEINALMDPPLNDVADSGNIRSKRIKTRLWTKTIQRNVTRGVMSHVASDNIPTSFHTSGTGALAESAEGSLAPLFSGGKNAGTPLEFRQTGADWTSSPEQGVRVMENGEGDAMRYLASIGAMEYANAVSAGEMRRQQSAAVAAWAGQKNAAAARGLSLLWMSPNKGGTD